MIELFKSIGLKSDPFTTSPNVEKFYPATEHRQCLEGLELSVRLRRGLSVIRGGIGVGKTTFTRYLINYLQKREGLKATEVLSPTFNLLYEYDLKKYKILRTE